MESNFSLLDVAAVMKGYRSAKRRVIFLDYGGTICTTPKRSIAYYAHANKVHVRPNTLSLLIQSLACSSLVRREDGMLLKSAQLSC